MEYAAFVFGIFGLMAYLETASLKKRINRLEEQLSRTTGTSFHDEHVSLKQAVKACIGQKVKLELKEDYTDADIMMYGNTQHGSNVITDADEDWLLVHTETPKGSRDKLIRVEAVKSISLDQ